MAQLVIVADDLTGAADTGACFADAGLITAIRFEDSAVPSADVVVVSTESRDLDEVAATEAVRSALTATAGNQIDARPRWIYKFINTQQGTIGPGSHRIRIGMCTRNGDPRAAWALLTVEVGKPVQVKIRRVLYDVASMADAIRAADGLPDHFAADIETGGAS